jgi:hypothetical protein
MEASGRNKNRKLTTKSWILIVENFLDGNDVGLNQTGVSVSRIFE